MSAKILLVGKYAVPPQHIHYISLPVPVCVAAESYICNLDQLLLTRRKLVHL